MKKNWKNICINYISSKRYITNDEIILNTCIYYSYYENMNNKLNKIDQLVDDNYSIKTISLLSKNIINFITK